MRQILVNESAYSVKTAYFSGTKDITTSFVETVYLHIATVYFLFSNDILMSKFQTENKARVPRLYIDVNYSHGDLAFCFSVEVIN